MVTKPSICSSINWRGSVLAKIHMVTKLTGTEFNKAIRSVLAKIHMVTKRGTNCIFTCIGSVLAKIHMVTKQENNG